MKPDAWMKSAQHRLKAARLLLNEGYYSDAVSRLYYAGHAASKALLAIKGEDPGTHSAVIRRLGFHFRNQLGTGLMHQLLQDRMDCDYRLVQPQPEHVSTRLGDIEQFIADAEKLI